MELIFSWLVTWRYLVKKVEYLYTMYILSHFEKKKRLWNNSADREFLSTYAIWM